MDSRGFFGVAARGALFFVGAGSKLRNPDNFTCSFGLSLRAELRRKKGLYHFLGPSTLVQGQVVV